jgi:Icc-related predicted phosphoesterase
MKVIAISDPHTKHDRLYQWLEPADMIICAGDVMNSGRKEQEAKNFLNWFSALPYKYKIFIAGNHDFFFQDNPEKVKEMIPEGVIYLNDSSITIEGHKIYGSPVTPYFYNWAFNRHRGAEIKKHWDMIEKDTNVLITHGPAFGIHDYVPDGSRQPNNPSDNVGCVDLLNRIAELKNLKVHICGHIHEGYGDVTLGGVRYINASFLNDRYEPAHRPVFFDLPPSN